MPNTRFAAATPEEATGQSWLKFRTGCCARSMAAHEGDELVGFQRAVRGLIRSVENRGRDHEPREYVRYGYGCSTRARQLDELLQPR